MNIYKTTFFVRCPVNDIRICYTLTIKTKSIILVEKLVDYVSNLDKKLHEELADILFSEFKGCQILAAEHHGVFIQTVRV